MTKVRNNAISTEYWNKIRNTNKKHGLFSWTIGVYSYHANTSVGFVRLPAQIRMLYLPNTN